MEFVAAKHRGRDELERDTRIGYQAVRIYVETMNHKRMPTFQKLLPWNVSQGAPTPSEQKARFEALSAHIGVPIRPVVHKESKN